MRRIGVPQVTQAGSPPPCKQPASDSGIGTFTQRDEPFREPCNRDRAPSRLTDATPRAASPRSLCQRRTRQRERSFRPSAPSSGHAARGPRGRPCRVSHHPWLGTRALGFWRGHDQQLPVRLQRVPESRAGCSHRDRLGWDKSQRVIPASALRRRAPSMSSLQMLGRLCQRHRRPRDVSVALHRYPCFP